MRPTNGEIKRHAGFGARHRLREAEEQRQVAVNAFALELGGGANAFPRAADLDQDALARDAGLLVQADQLARLGDGAGGVEAQSRIDFRRDAAGHDLQDLAAEVDGQAIHERFGARRFRDAGSAIGIGERGFDQRPILRLLRRLQQQRRVGGGVLRPELPHRLDVAGIGHDGGEALERIEQGHGRIRIPEG